jgi:hypothetical protein
LKVIQDPSPTIGKASPVDGIGFVAMNLSCPAAAQGQTAATAPDNNH